MADVNEKQKRTASGHLRRELGPAIALLKKQTEEGRTTDPFVPAASSATMTHEKQKGNARAKQIKFETILTKLTKTIERIQKLTEDWNAVIDQLENDERTDEQEIFDSFDEDHQLNEAVNDAEEVLGTVEENGKLAQIAIERYKDLIDQSAPVTAAAPERPRIQLPMLQPIRFDGNPSKWMTFWEFFSHSIDKSNLENVQKLTYLISFLDSNAKKVIEGYEVVGSNYDIVKEVLEEKFGRKELIAENLIRELNEMDTPGSKIQQLKNFSLDIDRIRRQLTKQAIEMNHHQYTHIVETKLKNNRKLLEKLIEKKRANDHWNAEKLCKTLDELILTQEELEEKSGKPTTDRPSPRRQVFAIQSNGRQEANNYRKETNQHMDQKQNYPNRFDARQNLLLATWPCIFCDLIGHKSKDCRKYKTGEERKERLREKKRCFKCLKPSHFPRICNAKCYECNGHHHSTICYKLHPNLRPQEGAPKGSAGRPKKTNFVQKKDENKEVQEEGTHVYVNRHHSTILPTVEVTITNPQNQLSKKVTALLDSASESTYMTTECAELLQIEPYKVEDINTEVFGRETITKIEARHVKVEIEQEDGKRKLIKALAVPRMVGQLKRIVKQRGRFQEVQITPELLIGSDYFFQFVEMPRREHHEWIEVPTKLGTMIIQNYQPTPQQTTAAYVTRTLRHEDFNEKEVEKRFWDLEAVGIQNEGELTVDDQIHDQFLKTMKFEDGRYSIQWLWNGKQKELKTNIGIAFHRLNSLMNVLNKNEDLKTKYKEIFAEQERSGIIEKVMKKDPDGIVSYLPHQPVITPQKSTTKLRVVYDASAKPKGGLSVNDVLHEGPLLLPQLVGLLLRFRLGKFATIGDLEKAFLQIGLQTSQRDVVRLLIPKDWEKKINHDNVQVYRFARVAFGICCSPSILAMTLQHLLQKHPEGKEIMRELYVDNLLMTSDDRDHLTAKTYRAKLVFQEGGFNLREIYSNCNKITHQMSTENSTKIEEKVLGAYWNFQNDTLEISIPKWKEEVQLTKRTALSHVASIYDPTGVLSPAIVPLKIYIQQLWKLNYGWDDALREELQFEWKMLIQQFENSENKVKFPRQVAAKLEPRQLHVFVDASGKAYGGAAYLITKHRSHLIFAKSRLAPMEKDATDTTRQAKKKESTISIPRLELLAITCGIRMTKFLKEELGGFRRTTIWSDSQVALQQIRGEKSKSVFVNNRVKEINEYRQEVELRFVPTEQNPADLITRGRTIDRLMKSSLWWEGPEFIRKDDKEWPDEVVIPTRKEDEEPRDEDVVDDRQIVAVTTKPHITIIDCTKHKWSKLILIMMIILQFVKKARKRKFDVSKEEAEETIIRQEQDRHPPNEKTQTRHRMFKDEQGNWRIDTRLKESNLPQETIYPMWLPTDSPITSKIVQEVHEMKNHQGANAVTLELRKRFWVSFRFVKTEVKRCVKCKIHDAKAFEMPTYAPLPSSRVTEGRPFSTTGLDIMGPMRSLEGEIFILLFTCLKIRAVHLEVVKSTKTENIMKALHRFIARRGLPDHLMSDNASYFVLAAKTLKAQYATMKIEWTFTTPRAPWRGGVYERLNRNIKEAIKRTFGRTQRTAEEYETIIAKIESTLNDRPLTSVTDDPEDHRILRPVDFLRPDGQEAPEENEIAEEDKDETYDERKVQKGLRKLHTSNQLQLQKFWNDWSNQYLLTLAERTPRTNATGNQREPKIGELVLLHEEEMPRNKWKLGRILTAEPGKDGIIRTIEILLPNRKTTKRAVNHCYPLEIGGEDKTLTRPTEIIENQERRHQPSRVAKTRGINLTRIFTALVKPGLMLTLFAILSICQAQKPMICHEDTPQTLWRITSPLTCDYSATDDHNAELRNFTVYKPNHVEYHGEGYVCKLISSTVTQWTELNGVEQVEERENPLELMDETECQQMIQHRTCSQGKLQEGRHSAQTMNEVERDVPNRLRTTFIGPKKAIKRNCVLLKTKIYAHHNETKATSPLVDLSQCTYRSGGCQQAKNVFVIWIPNSEQQCEFAVMGKVRGVCGTNYFVMAEWQMTLTFDVIRRKRDCGHDLILTDQGLALEGSPPPLKRQPTTTTPRPYSKWITERTTPIPTTTTLRMNKRSEWETPSLWDHVIETLRRTKRQATVGETEAADMQYLAGKIQALMESLTRSMCNVVNGQNQILLDLSKDNPDVYFRTIFKKRNYEIERLTDSIFAVRLCQQLEPQEYRILPNEFNCSIPVLIYKLQSTWFLDRRTMKLYKSWQEVDESPCPINRRLAFSEIIYTYNRRTGDLSANQQTITEQKSKHFNVSMINNRVVIRHTPIHEAKEWKLDEELINELEIAAETHTEVKSKESVRIVSTDLEGFMFDWWIERFKTIWIVWVTITCLLITLISLFCAYAYVKRKLNGKPDPTTARLIERAISEMQSAHESQRQNRRLIEADKEIIKPRPKPRSNRRPFERNSQAGDNQTEPSNPFASSAPFISRHNQPKSTPSRRFIARLFSTSTDNTDQAEQRQRPTSLALQLNEQIPLSPMNRVNTQTRRNQAEERPAQSTDFISSLFKEESSHMFSVLNSNNEMYDKIALPTIIYNEFSYQGPVDIVKPEEATRPFIPLISVLASHPNDATQARKIWVILDSGSSCSWLETKIATDLHLVQQNPNRFIITSLLARKLNVTTAAATVDFRSLIANSPRTRLEVQLVTNPCGEILAANEDGHIRRVRAHGVIGMDVLPRINLRTLRTNRTGTVEWTTALGTASKFYEPEDTSILNAFYD